MEARNDECRLSPAYDLTYSMTYYGEPYDGRGWRGGKSGGERIAGGRIGCGNSAGDGAGADFRPFASSFISRSVACVFS